MPATIDSQTLATLRHYADGGDKVAQAIVAIFAGTYFAKDTAISAEGADTANTIKITGQIVHQDGSPRAGVIGILAKSYPPAGVGTMTVHSGGGTAKKGSASTELWLETTSTGSFIIDVLDASVEDCLIRLETDNGEVNLIKLTYA